VSLLPIETVRASVAVEMPAARAWAQRQGFELEYDNEALSLCLRLTGPGDEPYALLGTFEDYPTLPPIWRFVHPETGHAVGRAAYPAPAEPYPRGSALVIDAGVDGAVICAHFNRHAFTEEGGPHGDWGPLTNWQNPGASPYTFAITISDMLARIALDVRDSSGRKAPLP
jgi:hypothetical protein